MMAIQSNTHKLLPRLSRSFCGCGIIIRWLKWLRGEKKSKSTNENARHSTEALLSYANVVDNAVDKAVSALCEIEPMKIKDERRSVKSAAPLPVLLKEIGQDG